MKCQRETAHDVKIVNDDPLYKIYDSTQFCTVKSIIILSVWYLYSDDYNMHILAHVYTIR